MTTKKKIQNLLKREMDTLRLINLYFKEFEEEYGKKGLKDYIDERLDNINKYKKILKKLKN